MTLVIYDIADDGLRADVAHACRVHGLTRLQFSAYIGDLDHRRVGLLRAHMALYLARTSSGRRDVQLLTLCADCDARRIVLSGQSNPNWVSPGIFAIG